MADELAWAAEEIPGSDSVFMRAHRAHFRSGELTLGVFRAQQGAMSVNWDKYASAQETRSQAKTPDDNAILSLNVGSIRKINGLDVKHTPESENRAHSDVNLPSRGEELTEVRVLLHRIAAVILPLDANPQGQGDFRHP